MSFSVKQIDDLQSSNKKQSWTLRLPCLLIQIGKKLQPSLASGANKNIIGLHALINWPVE